jgi:hypothetical protein
MKLIILVDSKYVKVEKMNVGSSIFLNGIITINFKSWNKFKKIVNFGRFENI